MQIYAAKNNNRMVLRNSSSGGIFVPLSDEVLRMQGAVVCSSYDFGSNRMRFSLITDVNARDNAVGSKYMQSDAGTVFCDSKKWLLEHPEGIILFVGTGCQAAAYLCYMKQNGLSDRIVTVDLICSGVPSPVVWEKYAELLKHRHKGKISYLTFKDKTDGWSRPRKYIEINGKKIDIRAYCKTYSRNYIFRPSCHCCPYTTMKRDTDITIGDFWGVKERLPSFYTEDGVSVVFVHTKKGQELFARVKAEVNVCEIDSETCKQPRLLSPSEANSERDNWWRDYHTKGAEYTLRHYSSDGAWKDLKRKVKKILGGGVSDVIPCCIDLCYRIPGRAVA